jgi:transcriptional regulator with XRE-family HTH domain
VKGIGERIRTLRESRGWKQREFAKRLGISQPAVAFWELDDGRRGGTKPSPANLYKVAKLLGVTPQYLLFGDKEPAAKRKRAA